MEKKKVTFSEAMEKADVIRASRIRNEYGRVAWLVSWHEQENGLWLARLSAPKVEETIEALAQSRCQAIDMATRKILDIIHRMSSGEDCCPECGRSFGN